MTSGEKPKGFTTKCQLGGIQFVGGNEKPKQQVFELAREMYGEDARSTCVFMQNEEPGEGKGYIRFGVARTHQEMIESLSRMERSDWHNFELLVDRVKPYLDIDCRRDAVEGGAEMTSEAFAERFEGHVLEALEHDLGLEGADRSWLYWSEASTSKKISLHLTVTTPSRQAMFPRNRVRNPDGSVAPGCASSFAHAVYNRMARAGLEVEAEAIDMGVYTTDRAMRHLGCSKYGKGNPLKKLRKRGSIYDYLVTHRPEGVELRILDGVAVQRAGEQPNPDCSDERSLNSDFVREFRDSGRVWYHSPNSREWYTELLRIIPESRWQSRDSWLRICAAMKRQNLDKELFDEMSQEKGGEKYGGVDALWNSIDPQRADSPGFRTLLTYAREGDEAAVKRLMVMPESDPTVRVVREILRQRGSKRSREATDDWRFVSIKAARCGADRRVIAQASEDSAPLETCTEDHAPCAIISLGTGAVTMRCPCMRGHGIAAGNAGRVGLDHTKTLAKTLMCT